MSWLKSLFGRKPKTVPFEPPKRGPYIIGRQAGQRRNRVHIYVQPYGYPIRLCDWIVTDILAIEEVARGLCLGGVTSPRTTLAIALERRKYLGDQICRHCEAVVAGKRASIGVVNGVVNF